jgi:para-nitrobenzyl esterase
MRFFSYIFIAVFSLSLLSTGASAHKKGDSNSTVVDTSYGQVEGVAVEGFDVTAWKGMPYAKPPVADLRWKQPQDADGWDGVRDGSVYGNRCSRSEDCLYVNVWRPDSDGKSKKSKKGHKSNKSKQGKLPVFFYVHGGSNTGGSGEADWHTTAQEYNAVVVSINYRVGAMGWFSHPALKTGDLMDDSGNFGLLDQVKALQWVQDNIEKFGGDRKNVTIVGASAGAQNVSYLMHTHLARDLFHKAIMESNYPGIRPVSAATKSSKQVLYNLMVEDGSAVKTATAKTMADAMSAEAIRDYFYSKPRGEIRAAYGLPPFGWYWGGINWGDFDRSDIDRDNTWTPPPIVQITDNRPEFVYTIGDGYVLPNDLDFADFSAGRGYPKPMVIGTTLNENNAWNAYWPFNYRPWDETAPQTLEEYVNEAITGGDPYLMGFGDTPEVFMENYTFSTRLIDELDMYLGAQLLARNMAQGKKSPRIYVYRFDFGANPDLDNKIPNEDAWKFYVGAPHTEEYNFFWQRFLGHGPGDSDGPRIPYQYTDENLPGRLAVSEAALAYLSDFLHDKKGKIKKQKGLPDWKEWTDKKEQFLVFDGDYQSAMLSMNKDDIYRTPQELYDAYLAHPNPFVRDFIAYYVMWSWHYNWYQNASVDPFNTAPGPNDRFDPLDP